jgi:hypothetical protein
VKLRATILAALAIATCMAAAPLDSAVIIDSGSTNSYGYTIHISSDGAASVTMTNRGSAPASSPKPFTVPQSVTSRFFTDLAAARKGNAATVACMKSASFGTTLHITWQGWTSPDLSCPAKDQLGQALVNGVDAIRKAGNIPAFPLRSAQTP